MKALIRRFRGIELPAFGETPVRPASSDLVPWLVTGTVAATLVVGQVAQSYGVDWRAETQPLYIMHDPVVTAWALVAIAGLALSLVLGIRLFRSGTGPAAFAFWAFVLAVVSRLALNAGRVGPDEWDDTFESGPGKGGDFEYLAALPELERGVSGFLGDFASLVPSLPVHAAGHPPGMLVLIDALGIETPAALAVLTIAVGAMVAPVLYLLARRLFEETTARIATLLVIFVPSSLLYGVTSADAMFATIALVAVALLLSRKKLAIVAGSVALAVASFFSYALLAAGGWAGLVIWRRDGTRSMVGVALLCAAALVVFYLALGLATGFNVLAAIEATNERYHDGIAGVRPYLFWMFGSPAAFLIMLGPVTWFASRSLASRETAALALAAVILVAVLLGFTKAETERIWLFLVPLACIAAARSLPPKYLTPMVAALATQALIIQVLFSTHW